MKAKAANYATTLAKIILDEYSEYEKSPKEYNKKHPADNPALYFDYIKERFKVMKAD